LENNAGPSGCRECKQPLVEIDDRGIHLTGCMTCNVWWSRDGEKVRLSEEDLRALYAMRRLRGAATEADASIPNFAE
jgi:hypothetical protein